MSLERAPKSNLKTILLIAGVIGGVATALFVYLMWYVSPAQTTEIVKVIAVTEDGCIAETFDGHPVNIGKCDAQPGQIVEALVDQKTKERAMLMNPTK